jgi:hypothetical protein
MTDWKLKPRQTEWRWTMAADPNRNRDQSLAEIARYLKSIDITLKEIVRRLKRSSGDASFRSYISGEEEDGASTPAGSAEPGPYGTGTSQPYT